MLEPDNQASACRLQQEIHKGSNPGLGIDVPATNWDRGEAGTHSPLWHAIRNLSSARRGAPRHTGPEHETCSRTSRSLGQIAMTWIRRAV